jgi:hypothetical protein
MYFIQNVITFALDYFGVFYKVKKKEGLVSRLRSSDCPAFSSSLSLLTVFRFPIYPGYEITEKINQLMPFCVSHLREHFLAAASVGLVTVLGLASHTITHSLLMSSVYTISLGSCNMLSQAVLFLPVNTRYEHQHLTCLTLPTTPTTRVYL